jgi:phage terminase large subunit-like protein
MTPTQRAKLAILETLHQRRAQDHYYQFKPTQRQQAFVDAVLHGDMHENWLIAANRAGKTKIGAFIGASLLRFGREPLRPAISPSAVVWDRAVSGWVVSPDFPSSRDTVQPYLFNNGFGGGTVPFIPEWEIDVWRASDQVLKMRNGSLVAFKSADSGRAKFQGRALDFIHFDEEPPKAVYEECTIRVGAGKVLLIFGTCTILPPEGEAGGVSWMYDAIIDPWLGKRRTDVGLFGASIYDNPFLDAKEIERLESRYPMGSVERAIRLNGEWRPGMAGTRAYPAFESSLHVRDLGEPHPRRPLCWSWDFNVDPLCSIVGQYAQGMFQVFDEVVISEASISKGVEGFREKFPTHQADIWIYGDATGKRRNGQTGRSDYYLIQEYMRDYPTPVRYRVPESNPRQGDRINAVNSALVKPGGLIGVEIDPKCIELIKDMNQVLRDHKGGIKKTTDQKNPYSRRTGTSDALGYWITKTAPVTSYHAEDVAPRVTSVPIPGYSWKKSANSAGNR